jgi:hemoglobin-like flavoprotein
MTPEQINLVKTSFNKVFAIRDIASAYFYRKLFELEPSVRPMFVNSDMDAQRDKLMVSLRAVINHLDYPETIIPDLRQMAKRHVEYGVRPEHYKLVGDAMIYALQQGLGSHFTPGMQQAWMVAYEYMADNMIESAYPKRSAA